MRWFLGTAILLVAFARTDSIAGPTKCRPLVTGSDYPPIGYSRMYRDLGNGIIKDQRTGLFWEKKSDDGSVHDKDLRFTYAAFFVGDKRNGTAFSEFLNRVNCKGSYGGPSCEPLGGFTDWRLPTRFELETILDLGKKILTVPPAFNTACYPGCTIKECSCTGTGAVDGYWSVTEAGFADAFGRAAWVVQFGSGVVTGYQMDDQRFVRAVRGGTP